MVGARVGLLILFIACSGVARAQSPAPVRYEPEVEERIESGLRAPAHAVEEAGGHWLLATAFGERPGLVRLRRGVDATAWRPVGEPDAALGDGRLVRMGDLWRWFSVRAGSAGAPASLTSASGAEIGTLTPEPETLVTAPAGMEISRPSVIRLRSGTWRMFFHLARRDAGRVEQSEIRSARSSDGATWVVDDGVLLTMDADEGPPLHPCVIALTAGGYSLFYDAGGRLCSAWSPDGQGWTRMGLIGLEGADADAEVLDNGRVRLYFARTGLGLVEDLYSVDLNARRGNREQPVATSNRDDEDLEPPDPSEAGRWFLPTAAHLLGPDASAQTNRSLHPTGQRTINGVVRRYDLKLQVSAGLVASLDGFLEDGKGRKLTFESCRQAPETGVSGVLTIQWPTGEQINLAFVNGGVRKLRGHAPPGEYGRKQPKGGVGLRELIESVNRALVDVVRK